MNIVNFLDNCKYTFIGVGKMVRFILTSSTHEIDIKYNIKDKKIEKCEGYNSLDDSSVNLSADEKQKVIKYLKENEKDLF